MNKKLPRNAYVITLGFGLLAGIISAMLTPIEMSLYKGILINATIFFLFGIVIGLRWPTGSWKLGLFLPIPAVSFIGLSVLFAGHIDMFLKNDLPLLLAIVLTSSLGGLIGSSLRGMRQRKKNSDNGDAED